MREPPTQARVALRATCASLTLSKQSLASASVKEKIGTLSVSRLSPAPTACALRSHASHVSRMSVRPSLLDLKSRWMQAGPPCSSPPRCVDTSA